MSLRLNKYITNLRRGAHRFEYTDINNKISNSFLDRNQRRIICIIPSLTIVLFLKNGFTQEFVAYASTAISILIGLFSANIIFILDKYKSIDKETMSALSSREKLWDIQAYNYTKQFAYVTGYSIVLCVYVIILLSLCALFPDVFNSNLWKYKFCFNEFNYKTIGLALINSSIIIQRFLVLYWLFSIAYNTLYAISSMINFTIVKIDRQ